MKVTDVCFVKSVYHLQDLPKPALPEFAFSGRSNVGKSSLINTLLNRKGFAKTSATPGRTQSINFMEINSAFCFVDLPGYGYAHASHAEKDRWSKLIADYCTKRENLKGVIWLLDIRHPGTAADREALAWLATRDLPLFPVFTKCDKESQQQVAANRKAYRAAFGLLSEGVNYTTARHKSRQSFWTAFDAWVASLEG